MATIEDFVKAVRHYCDLVETAHGLPLESRIRAFAGALAQLYLLALALPDTPGGTDELLPGQPTSLPHWPGFGKHEVYSEVFDPYHDELVQTTLTDDVLDIYRDLMPGFIAYESGDPARIADAVWHWRFHFETHWGCHVVDAMRALHRALSN